MGEMESREVDFRGSKREVEWQYEGDHVIVWAFIGCDECQQTPEGDITQAEIDSVHEQLWAVLEDFWAPSAEDDR